MSAICIWQEIALLSRLRHPNIVRYFGSETVRFLCSLLWFCFSFSYSNAILFVRVCHLAFHLWSSSLLKMCHVPFDFFWILFFLVMPFCFWSITCINRYLCTCLCMRICENINMLEVLIITSSESSGPHGNFQAACLCVVHHEGCFFCNWFFRFYSFEIEAMLYVVFTGTFSML